MPIAEADITKVKQKIYADSRLLERVKACKNLDEVTEAVHAIAGDLGVSLDKAELRANFQDAPADAGASDGRLSDEDLEAVSGGKGGTTKRKGSCKYCLSTSGTYCVGTS